MFAYQDTAGGVEIAFTDRRGGTSGGPFASLNLSDATGDQASAVRRNLRLLVAALAPDTDPPRPALMHQVHGAHVHRVVTADLDEQRVPVADALVSDLAGVALVVRVADCVPVLLADPAAGVVAAAHAGRQGLVAGVVPRTVDAMAGLGAERMTAWIGPCVCGGCYEVPEDLRDEVVAAVPAAWSTTTWGTPAVDVAAGVRAQLTAAGVATTTVARCTIEDLDLYSYRRQGRASGRLAGVVWRRAR